MSISTYRLVVMPTCPSQDLMASYAAINRQHCDLEKTYVKPVGANPAQLQGRASQFHIPVHFT